MKTVLFALIGSAAAFAPSQQTSRASTSLAAFTDEPGVVPPLGLWDPMGILKGEQGEARFPWFRTAELKHGRIAMLAVTGYLTTAAGIRFPGCEKFPDGLAAFPALAEDLGTGRNVLAQMILTMAVAEIANQEASYAGIKQEFIGDFRNGALDFGWDKFDDATKMRKRNIEM